jgi:hypothetical protein
MSEQEKAVCAACGHQMNRRVMPLEPPDGKVGAGGMPLVAVYWCSACDEKGYCEYVL